MLETDVATDVEVFCSRYRQLANEQRFIFWGQLFAAIAKYESAWDPTSRMVETSMGTDPITKEQVASEGLLQLSYQDSLNHGFENCPFDWSSDKKFHAVSPKDPRKSILNPYINLQCGIHIMSNQLKKHKAIAVESGAYWAVIKLNYARNKIKEISAITQSLSFCK